MNAPDLTARPPRSPRVRLGGYAILPRILDKARATLAGTNGEYVYNNPTDQHFFRFTGITAPALIEQVRTGAGDWEILRWVRENAPHQHAPWEVESWNRWVENLGFHDVAMRDWFTGEIRRLNPERDDIRSVFDRLDLDDHVSFGGRA